MKRQIILFGLVILLSLTFVSAPLEPTPIEPSISLTSISERTFNSQAYQKIVTPYLNMTDYNNYKHEWLKGDLDLFYKIVKIEDGKTTYYLKQNIYLPRYSEGSISINLTAINGVITASGLKSNIVSNSKKLVGSNETYEIGNIIGYDYKIEKKCGTNRTGYGCVIRNVSYEIYSWKPFTNLTFTSLSKNSFTVTDPTNWSICGNLPTANEYYTLNKSLSINYDDNCININNNGTTFDMQGFNITGLNFQYCFGSWEECADYDNNIECWDAPEEMECGWIDSYPVGIWSLKDNLIIKNGLITGCGDGINLVDATNNTVTNMTLWYNHYKGIYLVSVYSTVTNNLITNNTINYTIPLGDFIYNDPPRTFGIYELNYSGNKFNNNTISNNLIRLNEVGIYFKNVQNETIKDNVIRDSMAYISDGNLYGGSGIGFGLVGSQKATDILIINNTFINNSFGINTGYSPFETFTTSKRNQFIGNSFINNTYGICLTANDSIIRNNTFIINTFSSAVMNHGIYGIYLISASNTTTENNKINLTDYQHQSGYPYTGGIIYNKSSNNIQANNTYYIKDLNTGTHMTGIGFYNSNYNNITNDYVWYNGSARFDYSVFFDKSSNNFIKDIKLDTFYNGFWGALPYSIYSELNSFNNTFLNCSYNNSFTGFQFLESVTLNGTLIRKWYYQAYVNDSNGDNVSNANVTAYNSSNNYQFSLLTDATGYTFQTTIIDYINNAGTRSYYSNYTITATDSSGHQSNHSLNVTQINNYQDKFQLSCWSWLNRLFDYPAICGSDIDSALKEIFI